MIIDEVSMIDLSTLKTIEVHCNNARSLPSTSPDRFGGLPGDSNGRLSSIPSSSRPAALEKPKK
jgi:hypothetical protein